MLLDLLNSANYIMINMDAIRIFGLDASVYLAELFNVYKKAKLKKKLVSAVDGDYFKVDRKYIEERTSLTLEKQLACDCNLEKIGMLSIYNNEADTIKLDVEMYASLIAGEDIKLTESISKKVKVVSPKGVRQKKSDSVRKALKEGILCSNEELLLALRGWVDSIFDGPSPYLSKNQIEIFQNELNNYTKGDLDLALKVVEIATIHSYKDCKWAINLIENSKNRSVRQSVRTTRQEVATQEGLDTNNIF